MYLQYKMEYNFAKFNNLVELLRNQNQNPEAIENELENLSIDPEVISEQDIFQFVMTLLNEPMVYMELLSTLVSMQLYGQKVTQSIKNEFLHLTYQDTVTLTGTNSPFVRNNSLKDPNNEGIKNVALNMYNALVPDFVNADDVSDVIDIFVMIANEVLGNNAGDKALIAAQTSVWGAGAFIQAYSKACQVRAEGVSDEKCQEANRMLEALTVGVQNLSLE